MKNLTILGSTGSIGCNTLNIIKMYPERFCVKALTGAHNIELLARQIETFRPDLAVVIDQEHADQLKDVLPLGTDVDILYGDDGYRQAATHTSVDLVVAAMVGAAGLMPTLAAIADGKDIALANKETLVMAGDIVMQSAMKNGVHIFPVDSEHSAIFQSIAGNRKADIEKIYITASGGPFLNTPRKKFIDIKPNDALNHPNWQMGKKISIDSATLMNKGLEVIEAATLFDVPREMIEVVIHPQSIIHSMVGYKDGSVISQMGVPDMKSAIAYAISYPERLPIKQPLPNFFNIGSLTFNKPDLEKFPCLKLALNACKIGNTMPAVLNAANEIAVNTFLNSKISFTDIPKIIQDVMGAHTAVPNPTLSDITNADAWARKAAETITEHIMEKSNS